MKKSDKYLKIVEWSEEDQCYIGSCPGLFYGGCHGEDETIVYQELCDIVEENIALYEKDRKPLPPKNTGKKFSGKFILRTNKELHQTLSIKSLQAGESLNSYCVKILKKAVFVD